MLGNTFILSYKILRTEHYTSVYYKVFFLNRLTSRLGYIFRDFKIYCIYLAAS